MMPVARPCRRREAIAASPSAATQNGGRGFCVGRGSEVTFSKLWKRPSQVTFSSSSSSRTCSMPSAKRARLSSSVTPKRANSCGRKARAKPISSRPSRDRIEHRDLAGELERVVEDRQHRAGDQPRSLRALRRGGEEDDRVGAVAAIGMEIVLDGADMAPAVAIGKLGRGAGIRSKYCWPDFSAGPTSGKNCIPKSMRRLPILRSRPYLTSR